MKYQPGHVFTTDGTHDVTDRVAKPRLILYPDGYGVPISADVGDWLAVAGVNNPPDVTERGVACFEPTKLLYCGPSQIIALMVARQELNRSDRDLSKLRKNNQPLPTCYVYHCVEEADYQDPTIMHRRMQEVAPYNVFVTYPEYTKEAEAMLDHLLHLKQLTEDEPPLQTAGLVTVNEDGEEVPYEGS